MAYARFSADCDVYVYADTRGGITCESCPRSGAQFRATTHDEMIEHLLKEHRGTGQRVPDEALERLRRDGGGDDRCIDEIFTEDRGYKAAITWRRDGLFQVSVLRFMPADEHEPALWSPIGRDVTLTDSFERARALAEEELRAYAER